MKKTLLIFFIISAFRLGAQEVYWQQHVRYSMDVDMDVERHMYHGIQTAVYTNRSPDTLKEIYYHLYWNAFQPGSAMYWHNHTRRDPDPRIERLAHLKPDQTGRYDILSITQDGISLDREINGTVMRVILTEPLAPGDSVELRMDYKVQIPVLVRRSGRDNKEGIAYSMAQWYPKIAEYRPDGWHADPYLGREFFGVWGDFDVRIRIDKNFTVAGTGYLQNEKEVEIYHFPDEKLRKLRRKNLKKRRFRQQKITWHFRADSVHDFSWAADPFYTHKIVKGPRNVMLHFYYVPDSRKKIRNWDSLAVYMPRVMAYYNDLIGPYPYRQYSFIQAGDGGMEYAMCTFIAGNRTLGSLVGTSTHELAHSWFQFVIATDESRHPWMDEGFTTLVSSMAMDELWYKPRGENSDYIFRFAQSVSQLHKLGLDEPMSMYSDFYDSHLAYWTNAYDKGALFLAGLGEIGGYKGFRRFLHAYYRKWKFKHPEPADMLRTAEKALGMELDWYYNHWVEGNKYPDYAIDTIEARGDSTFIRIAKKGNMPMPLTVLIHGEKDFAIHIPYVRTLHYLDKEDFDQWIAADDNKPVIFKRADPWPDGRPYYEIYVPVAKDKISTVLIENFRWFMDLNPLDNFRKKE